MTWWRILGLGLVRLDRFFLAMFFVRYIVEETEDTS